MRLFAIPNTDGTHIVRWVHQSSGNLTAQAIQIVFNNIGQPNAIPWIDEQHQYDAIQAQVENGQVTAVTAAPPEPELWLHGTLSGGTVNQLTGTRYVQRGDQLQYTAALRAGPEPDSDLVTHVPGTDPPVPLSGAWALELVHELGVDQYSPMVTLTEGQASGTLTIPDRLRDGLYRLVEERLAKVGPFKLRLADPEALAFKVRS